MWITYCNDNPDLIKMLTMAIKEVLKRQRIKQQQLETYNNSLIIFKPVLYLWIPQACKLGTHIYPSKREKGKITLITNYRLHKFHS